MLPSAPESVSNSGFTILYEPKGEDAIVDIVFIHGLQGHPMHTWTAHSVLGESRNSTNVQKARTTSRLGGWLKRTPKPTDVKPVLDTQGQNIFWPLHFLPYDCAKARILTWGYQSRVTELFGGPANTGTISSNARGFMGDLNGERLSNPTRPVVYVAHSLGGIITKDMLLWANESDDERYQMICDSTEAILFLGTPHKGGNFVDLGETARRVASAIGFDTNGKNIQALAVDSTILADLQRRFLKLYKNRLFKVITFQEGRGMKGIRGMNQQVVEDRSSSFNDSEDQFKIDANHMDMCRFSSKNDDGYKIIKRELQAICAGIEKKAADRIYKEEQELNAIQTSYLSSLTFFEMKNRQEEIAEVHSESCTWIFDHPQYKSWIAGDHDLLWIQGKPGSGKSTLMKRIFQSLNAEDVLSGQAILSFFFYRRGVSMQHTPVGMFQSLLYQIVTIAPSAGAGFFALCEEKKKHQGLDPKLWQWREQELSKLFRSVMLLAAQTRDFIIFVDALDEAGEDDASNIVSYMHNLLDELVKQGRRTRICFACRPYPVLTTTDGGHISVDAENSVDIANHVLMELNMIEPKIQSRLEELQEAMLAKASGIFLWVTLVLKVIRKYQRDGRSMDDIFKKLEETPTDLKDIYKQTLANIDPAFREQALHFMEWVSLAEAPLSLSELRCALALSDSHDEINQESVKSSKEFVESDSRMAILTASLSGGLAEILYQEDSSKNKPNVVRFIHQSVVDFLLKDGLMSLHTDCAENAVGRGHDRLTGCCINYLKLGEIQGVRRSIAALQRSRNKLGITAEETRVLFADVPFLTYTISTWYMHARKAELLGVAQDRIPQRFQWPETQYFETSAKLARLNFAPSNRIPSMLNKGTTMLHLATVANLVSTVKMILQMHTHPDTKDSKGETALVATARLGHKDIARLLLDAGADVSITASDGYTPLSAAIAGGHAEVVELLLIHGADPHQLTKWGDTPLSKAVEWGETVIANHLLNHGAEVNFVGNDTGSVLEKAVLRGDVALCRKLLQRGANTDDQGKHYGKALQIAAFRGHEAVCKLLFDSGAKITTKDKDSALALLRAASKGHEGVCKLLIDHGADINANFGSNDSETALEQAVYGGQEATCRLLLERGAKFLVQSEWYGHDYRAMERWGKVSTIKIQLECGADANQTDAQGRLPIHGALLNSSTEGLEYLLSVGATPNWASRDKQGRSALHFAVCGSGSSTSCLTSLLRVDPDLNINEPDSQGWTPLHWAARGCQIEVLVLLIRSGADINAKSAHGWTPLDVALHSGIPTCNSSQLFEGKRAYSALQLLEDTTFHKHPDVKSGDAWGDLQCSNCVNLCPEPYDRCLTCNYEYSLCFRCFMDHLSIHASAHVFEHTG